MDNTNTDHPSRKVNIEGMKGDSCVKKVSGVLQEVKGLTNPAVKVGSATFNANQSSCNHACTAINEAGFKAHPVSNPEKKSPGLVSSATKKIGLASNSASKPASVNNTGAKQSSDKVNDTKKPNRTHT